MFVKDWKAASCEKFKCIHLQNGNEIIDCQYHRAPFKKFQREFEISAVKEFNNAIALQVNYLIRMWFMLDSEKTKKIKLENQELMRVMIYSHAYAFSGLEIVKTFMITIVLGDCGSTIN